MLKKNEGRKLPTIIKKNRGTLRSDRVNPNEPDFENAESIPLAPTTIKTKPGQTLYVRCAIQLQGVGLLFPTVYEVLEKYCKAYERMTEAEKFVEDHGMILKNDKGNWVKNPALTVYNEAFTQFYNLAKEMGFTPVAKSKLISNAGSKNSGKANGKKKTTSLRKT